jgi:hypothetical protein
MSTNDEGRMATAPVSADGEFTLTDLESGTYAVGLSPRVFRSAHVVVRLAGGDEAHVELPMVSVGRLAVTAHLPDDARASPGELRLVREEDGARLGHTLALETGIARHVEGLPAGRYSAELTVPGTAMRPAQIAAVNAGGTTAVTFTWPTGELRGRVASVHGPRVGALVTAFRVETAADGRELRSDHPSHATYTDGDGNYRLTGLDPGHYLLGSMYPGLLGMADTALADGEHRRLDIVLATITSLRTRVVYRGAPVAGAQVLATSRPYSLNARSGHTDADGVAELPSLGRGTYHLHAVWSESDEGPLREARADIEIMDGEPEPVVLRLQ